MTVDRRRFKNLLDALPLADAGARQELLAAHLSADAAFHIAHPIDTVQGSEAVDREFWQPLKTAMPHLVRRDDLFMSGQSRTGSGEWIAAMGHYVGTFQAPLFGIPANQKLAFLRFGEFYKIESGKIVEARILIDLIDFMRQAGLKPLPFNLGTEMLFPAPASHDGIRLDAGDPAKAERSAELVEAMLSDLTAYDPQTFDSQGQSGQGGYWHENMLWYGPGGIGSNFRYEGFIKDHREPFLIGFPDRIGGNHYARFGDAAYVASGGWPSLNGTHAGPYLGVPATNAKIGMRVMDFWRCVDHPQTGQQIAENWVFIDMVDLFLQLGRDLLAGE